MRRKPRSLACIVDGTPDLPLMSAVRELAVAILRARAGRRGAARG